MNLWRAGRVVDVHVAVLAKTGVERHPEQAPLPAGVGVHLQKRPGQEPTFLDHARLPGLLGDEDPAVRRERQGRRTGDPPATSVSRKPGGTTVAPRAGTAA
ncbi:MAG: hypothetical protein M3157_02295 [Actinomycetota bacterium]|nr:hypothetical protein [Actinomycetota bacterium]